MKKIIFYYLVFILITLTVCHAESGSSLPSP